MILRLTDFRPAPTLPDVTVAWLPAALITVWPGQTTALGRRPRPCYRWHVMQGAHTARRPDGRTGYGEADTARAAQSEAVAFVRSL